MSESQNITTPDFFEWIITLKAKIQSARNKLAFSINSQVLELYWEIGQDIAKKQQKSGWGSNFVEKIAEELKQDFPEIKGFSRRNIYAILQWYRFYSEKYEFVPQGVAQIPWGHNRLIITKVKNIDEAEFYCRAVIQNAWDRDTLENDALEKAIEDELTKNITAFLLELGKGFAFLGRQYKVEIGENDHFLDMLFYHTELRCYVVIELKAGKFMPEYAGKLNYYLSAVDSLLRKPQDNPTIGILLCKKKNKIDVEYALRNIHKPIGISEYSLTSAIPEDIRPQLPSVEELERELKRRQTE